MSTPDTRERILDAAERLFAEQGFAATSLRSITAEAEANLAAVNYHFGSKEALIREVFGRLIRPLNQERFKMLDALEARSGDHPHLEDLLEAFVGPALRLARDMHKSGAVITRLLGRTYTEPSDDLRRIFFEQFREIKERFIVVLQQALPDLPQEELYWRLHFVIGALAQTMCDPHRLKVISDGACDPFDAEGTVRRLVPFLAAGMKSAVPASRPEVRG